MAASSSSSSSSLSSPPSPPFATDAASSEWFASLDREKQERVQKVVEGKSTELDLSYSKFTHIPGGVVETWKALTWLNLDGCESLAALPESLGQLQALTKLDLGGCSSLADESKDLARRLLQCNEKIRDGPSGSPERFHMTTYDFAATILSGSLPRHT